MSGERSLAAEFPAEVQARNVLTEQTTFLAVTRTGVTADGIPIRCLGPADLLTAYSAAK